MDAPNEVRYKPPPEFEEIKKHSLIDLNLKDSTELWLIQYPLNQHPDLEGQEVSLKLHHDGHMGSFEDSSGKSYEVVSNRALDPEAVVFLSSGSEPKVVGKITRRVSLIHYPEPSELKPSINLKQIAQRSSATTLTNSSRRFATPTQSNRPRSSLRSGSGTPSNLSSRNRSSPSEGEPSKSPSKSKHIDGPTKSNDQSFQDSGKEKSKKKRKVDGVGLSA